MSPREVFSSALLLAAGRSERLPPQKLLLSMGRSSMLVRSLDNLMKSRVDEIVVVLGLNADLVRRHLSKAMAHHGRVKTVSGTELDAGMGASLKAGLTSVDDRSVAFLIALGDMPFIRPETIDLLLVEFVAKGRGIVFPVYQGQRGHPAVFHRRYRRELESIHGDWGGREVMERHPHDLLRVEVDDRGVIVDIDDERDYALYGGDIDGR